MTALAAAAGFAAAGALAGLALGYLAGYSHGLATAGRPLWRQLQNGGL